MSNQPRLLLDCLTNTPWKQLTALLAAYQLPRTAQQTKAQVIEQLHHHLLPYFCTNRRHFNFFMQTEAVLTCENR